MADEIALIAMANKAHEDNPSGAAEQIASRLASVLSNNHDTIKAEFSERTNVEIEVAGNPGYLIEGGECDIRYFFPNPDETSEGERVLGIRVTAEGIIMDAFRSSDNEPVGTSPLLWEDLWERLTGEPA